MVRPSHERQEPALVAGPFRVKLFCAAGGYERYDIIDTRLPVGQRWMGASPVEENAQARARELNEQEARFRAGLARWRELERQRASEQAAEGA